MMHFNTLTAVVAALAFTQGIVAAPVLQGTSDLHSILQPRSDSSTEAFNPIDSATAQPYIQKRNLPHWADYVYLLIKGIFGGDKHRKHNYYSSSSAYNCGGYSYCNDHRRGSSGGYHDPSYSYSRNHPGYKYPYGGSSERPDFEDGTRGSYGSQRYGSSSSSSSSYDSSKYGSDQYGSSKYGSDKYGSSSDDYDFEDGTT